MLRKRVILIIIGVIIIFIAIIGMNFGSIIRFFQNKEWEIADSVANISINNFIKTESTLNDLLVVSSNHVKAYSEDGKEKMDLFIPYQEIVSSSAGDYCIIGEKNGSNALCIAGGSKAWETQINGSVNAVYVNKNGYAAIIYKQSGYKSLIKVMSPSGGELFTSYLASTYAVDVAITNDNKTLAIAEVDTEGIHIVSAVKMIDMNNPGNEQIKKITLDENCLIVDIAFNEKNELLVRTDAKIEVIKDGNRETICPLDYSNTLYATIENKNRAIIVTKEENGLFDVKYQLIVISTDPTMETKEYELYDIPKKIVANGDIIAVIMDKEVLMLNTNAKLTKKVNVSSNVKDVEIFDNLNTIGIVFRGTIELVKI